MFPKLHIESASMLIALYYITTIQAEIHQLFQGRACTNIIWVKLYEISWIMTVVFEISFTNTFSLIYFVLSLSTF